MFNIKLIRRSTGFKQIRIRVEVQVDPIAFTKKQRLAVNVYCVNLHLRPVQTTTMVSSAIVVNVFNPSISIPSPSARHD